MAETYDFIIIGAGSAGCVLANRLSEDRHATVLLLEADGRDRDPLIHIPIGIGKLWQERLHDWGYHTEVTRQAPLARFAGEEIFPGSGAATEQDLKASIRKGAGTFHHACGTCRMGSDEGAVVDAQLRVRGIERLRVIDASVLPDIVGANINACVIMVAEKASDQIRGRQPLAASAAPSGLPW